MAPDCGASSALWPVITIESDCLSIFVTQRQPVDQVNLEVSSWYLTDVIPNPG